MIFGRLTGCSFKQLFSVAWSIFFSVSALCQEKEPDFKFGNVNAKDFDVSSSKIVSPDDGAVILYESGSTHFVGNDKGWLSFVFTCTKRIKILNKNAFYLASIKIPLYKNDKDKEVLSDVKANTYNLNNGVVSSISMDKSSIFTEKEDEDRVSKKFALPAVQENSIIEYSYTITSPFAFNMPSWNFQTIKYPVLWSEYQASIPSLLTYVLIKQGVDSFFINKMWEGTQNYRVSKGEITTGQSEDLIVSANTVSYRWAKKDLPPLKIESYVSTPENYIDKISFQLAHTYNGAYRSEVVNTWEGASKFFLRREDFKQAISYDNTWIKEIPGLSANADDMQNAKAIYYYVQGNNICTDSEDIFTATDLYDVYQKQKGTIRGINLLLIAMLRNKGINAEPVVLSTRENGFVNPNFPVIDNLNYLICRAMIGGKAYLLDATDPVLGFGELSNKCYNGYARVISENRPDSLYLEADSLNESELSTLTLNTDETNKVTGTYKNTMGQMKSIDMRKQMRSYSNADEYFKGVKKSYLSDVDITNSKIDSLDQNGMPVSVQYDIDFKMNDDIVYFNPVAPDAAEKVNPFKAAQRSFPVEMPFCMNKTYILNMQVPTGYKVDELPKSARVALNDNEGMFQYLVQQTDDRIQLVCKLKLNKANFEPDDYETLRNFFAFVVEKESEQIVFKKI